ncbi:MAG: Glycosyl transferase group 1 [Candidatus Magasanikbacteria bacterium GW2011_GWA2_56_11]|uniref:Glycosyl transferase group 1 n=1 Tax=Candidatus Magasanikbacteria bacterium GW2011_GWA2_56_11 TaxID=1619044 RepID=A0A0G2B8S9_9BACT|nr:MAG: Glycosyl transferase group 1 [Candidatus Magasanikbacteria bacterium GW2011_GWA2_56_11]
MRYGYEVRVITKTTPKYEEAVARVAAEHGIAIIPVPYKYAKYLTFKQRAARRFRQVFNPRYWDGAAYEYFDPEIQAALARELSDHRPDLVWFDYTYLWPLYPQIRRAGIPIITRSINFEPTHFLQEEGRSPWHLLKFLPKLASEWRAIRGSNLLLAITPSEEGIYRRLCGRTPVITLPLRGLPKCLKKDRPTADRRPLNVFFMGSSYSVPHNLGAAEFLVREVIPEVLKRAPGEFRFVIFGAKLPPDIADHLPEQTEYGGLIDPEVGLADMDIAIIPSLFGAGMQQKIFEPLCRGIPTVASARGLAGYPFDPGIHLLTAGTREEFAAAVLRLRDRDLRARLSLASRERAQELFSPAVIDGIIRQALTDCL